MLWWRRRRGGLVSGLRRGVGGAGDLAGAMRAGGPKAEVDHRGIVLPKRHAVGGIITPQYSRGDLYS